MTAFVPMPDDVQQIDLVNTFRPNAGRRSNDRSRQQLCPGNLLHSLEGNETVLLALTLRCCDVRAGIVLTSGNILCSS